MSKLAYCSECEKMVLVDLPDGHTVYIVHDDVVFCDGPFYDTEPPMIDPDFDMQEEPSGDELFIMNKNAEELLYDLGV